MAILDGIGRSVACQHPSLKWAYLLIAMAVMIVGIAFLIGLFLLTPTVSDYADGRNRRRREVTHACLGTA